MTDLRTRQRDLARQSILDACADLITERRHLDFAMRDVAERAGVSLRTVYNHFATREDLLDALGQDFDDQMAERGGPDARDLRSGDDLLAAVRTNLRLFDELDGISEAIAQMPLADVGRHAKRAERTRILVDHLAGLMPNVPADDAHTIAVVLRHLLSHRSWFWLTREYGLDVDEVADVITWATATLVAAAEAGDLPSPDELTQEETP
ncbi:MAG: TetR/AcrR family transcriptional regulator [Acidimicrobiia bacterium]|nr:TetR/AcrR family transcriptional regulator [Acidimicrobiia bacterium]